MSQVEGQIGGQYESVNVHVHAWLGPSASGLLAVGCRVQWPPLFQKNHGPASTKARLYGSEPLGYRYALDKAHSNLLSSTALLWQGAEQVTS